MKKIGFVATIFTVLLFVASSLPSSPPMEEMEGTLEVIMATKVKQKTCEPLYFINIGGKKTQFSLPAHAPPNLSPGQKIKIAGRWDESGSGKKSFHCQKVTPVAIAPIAKKATSATDNASSYLPKQTPVSDEQKVLVICLNSPDTEDESPVWSEEKIDDKIFSNKHSLNAYWKECSQSKVWLTGDILDSGNWKTMPKNFTEYGYGSSDERSWKNEFINDMVTLLDPEVDFKKSQYDGMIIFKAGKNWAYDWSTLGKMEIDTDEGVVEIAISILNEADIEINNDYSSHETGHGLFSLIHAYSMSILSGEIYAYGDERDNRGGSFALLDTLHRYMLGWLNIDQIETVVSSGEYWLDQRELASSGIKLLVIPLGFDDDEEPILYYLEYYRGLGEFDSQLSFPNKSESVDANNLVLYRKYKISSDNGGYDSLVYVASDDSNDCLDLESEEFCDSDYENKYRKYGVCVQVLEKTGTGTASQAEVKITLTSDYSIPTPCLKEIAPVVSVSSEATTVTYPGKFEAEISVKNLMMIGCGTHTYTLKAELPDASWWTANFANSSLDVGGKSTRTTTISINVSETDFLSFGNYELKFKAVDADNENLVGEASLYIELLQTPTPTPSPDTDSGFG